MVCDGDDISHEMMVALGWWHRMHHDPMEEAAFNKGKRGFRTPLFDLARILRGHPTVGQLDACEAFDAVLDALNQFPLPDGAEIDGDAYERSCPC